MKLIVTIDVEEDAGPGWVSPPVPTFRGITEGIRDRLDPLFQTLGVKPTLMISPIVLHHSESVAILAGLQNTELAAHLHWEQIAPHAERTLRGGVELLKHMQFDFPPEQEYAKLEALTELFHQQFGFKPTAFRAGRYGASPSTGVILKVLGYEVDTSATPHIRWTTPGNNLVDYTRVCEQPYYIADNGNLYEAGAFDLLEVPITILPQDQIPGQAQAPWLRPGYASRETMKEMARIIRDRNQGGIEQPLVMMFHNVEVIPGASPYTKSEQEVGAYLADMRDTLSYAIELGFQPCTLSDYARDYKKRHASSIRTTARPAAPAAAPQARKPRLLFCVDVVGWAHDFKSENLIKHLSPRYDCRKCYERDVTAADLEWADVIIVYYWQQFISLSAHMPILQSKIVLSGISCHTDLEGDRRTLGMQVLNIFKGVFVHNQFLHEEYAAQFQKPFYLNQNGVDTDFYCPAPTPKPPGAPLIAGWAGSLNNHGGKRGYHDIILPAIQMTPGVELRTAAREDKWRGPEEMLEFYRSLDVYLVASRVEGTPNPGLESAACGVPVISTRVGNMPELLRDGENGFLIDRTPEALSAALARLRDDSALLERMRVNIRRDILAWDWKHMSQNYERMIAESLTRHGWQANN